jgi:hypothetical protein
MAVAGAQAVHAHAGNVLDWLESRRLPDGGWPADRRLYRHTTRRGAGQTLVAWGRGGSRRASEWVTVHALAVLSVAGRYSRSH